MMIDKLKCRAKAIENGKLICGIAGYDTFGQMMIRKFETVEDPESYFNGKDILYSYAIDGNTIDRCTHLTDKNGQEIYENDIVLIDGTNVRGRVWYSNVSGRWHVVSLRGKGWTTTMKELKRQFKMAFTARKKGGSLPLYYVVQHGCTVIGNKHDTPELLKVDEQ